MPKELGQERQERDTSEVLGDGNQRGNREGIGMGRASQRVEGSIRGREGTTISSG